MGDLIRKRIQLVFDVEVTVEDIDCSEYGVYSRLERHTCGVDAGTLAKHLTWQRRLLQAVLDEHTLRKAVRRMSVEDRDYFDELARLQSLEWQLDDYHDCFHARLVGVTLTEQA